MGRPTQLLIVVETGALDFDAMHLGMDEVDHFLTSCLSG
jgi:hypothetical protein